MSVTVRAISECKMGAPYDRFTLPLPENSFWVQLKGKPKAIAVTQIKKTALNLTIFMSYVFHADE